MPERTFNPAQIAAAVAEAKRLQEQDCQRIAQTQLASTLEERIRLDTSEAVPEEHARRIARELAESERIPAEYLERVLRARHLTTADHDLFAQQTGAQFSEDIKKKRLQTEMRTIVQRWTERVQNYLQMQDGEQEYHSHVETGIEYHDYGRFGEPWARARVERTFPVTRRTKAGMLHRWRTGEAEKILILEGRATICELKARTVGISDYPIKNRLSDGRIVIEIEGRDPRFSLCAEIIQELKEKTQGVAFYAGTLHYE